MRLAFVVLFAAGSSVCKPLPALPNNPPTAASIRSQLEGLTVDPSESFHVRDLRLRRGDVSIYLTEGVLAFALPVDGRRLAAVFTTEKSEAGDGEVILLPAQASERASLASATGTPTLDEHFDLAVFFFSDDTASELLAQIAGREMPGQPPPALEHMNGSLQVRVKPLVTPLVHTLFDAHSSADGLFYATFVSRQLGTFDFFYQPATPEPVTIGASRQASFQIWTAYRPRRMPAFTPRPLRIDGYKIDGTIGGDLGLTATASFRFTADSACGRTIPLDLSPRLHVESATVDGRPAEFLQQPGATSESEDTDMPLLVVTPGTLTAGRSYTVAVSYSGVVVRRMGEAYFVGERTSWFPHIAPLLTTFDITLRCPDRYRLVLTGERVDESVSGHIRTVHCRTGAPSQLAGFNLGEYSAAASLAGRYHLEVYALPSAKAGMNGVPEQAASILGYYTQRWLPLPIHSLAVTPIPGYFGQGFPGLIYLSTMSYLPDEDRPPELRNQRSNNFFSQLLLPHEIAHQWWGNLVTPADYRTAWLMEAMANYAALEEIQQQGQSGPLYQTLATYRHDLLALRDGKPVEQAGPVDFGTRILQNSGNPSWHTIVYGKGAWVLHMLRLRLGDSAFHDLERRTLQTYSGKSITNDQFRLMAASVNSGRVDRTLTKFFDTWVYGTGIPLLELQKTRGELVVTVKGVDEGFTADLPLRCKLPRAPEETRWVSIVTGENSSALQPGETCQLPKESDFLYAAGS